MSLKDHTQAGWRRYFSSSSTGTLLARRISRTRYLALEFLESRQLLSTTVTEYPTSLLGSPPSVPSQPTDVVSLSGKLWFTEFGNAIGMLNPATSPPTIKSYSQGLPAGSGPQSIMVGPDGKLWFTELFGGAIGMLDPASLSPTIQNYGTSQGMPANAQPFGITTGPDGRDHQVIWFTDVNNNAIGEISPSGTITEIKVPSTMVGFSTFNSVITAGPGGKLYFTESGTAGTGIGIYNPSATPSQAWTEVKLPSSKEVPFGLTVGPDGNIWFSEGVLNSSGTAFQSSGLGIVLNPSSSTPSLNEPSSLSVSGSSAPYRITIGPDGDIWFTLPSAGQIGVVQVESDPTKDTISTITVPTSTPTGITAGPDGNVWFTDTHGAMGRATLNTHLVITAQPTAPVLAGSSFDLTAKVEYSDTNAVDRAYTGNVAIALTNPASNTLGGTKTVPISAGVATFTTLTLANAGTGFTLKATATATVTADGLTQTLTSAPSAGIKVTAPAPRATQLLVWTQPTTRVPAGSRFSLVIHALTSTSALASSYSGTVTLTLLALATNPPGAFLGGTRTVTASGGVASFSGLTLNLPGSYVIRATASGMSSASTMTITVPRL